MSKTLLRLCEYGSLPTALSESQRESIAAAAITWQEHHHLPRPPLAFQGTDGKTLTAQQFVGTVEVGDVCVEIYPKLDKDLVEPMNQEAQVDAVSEPQAESVLHNLLWLLEIVNSDNPLETDTGGLEEAPTTFFDLFALLFARNLRAELIRGTLRRYETCEGILSSVRGRLHIREQVTRQWERFDKIACVWDEFTPDIALNRVLCSACRFLQPRITNTSAHRFLSDCIELLDEVEIISVPSALALAQSIRHFDRTMERFRLSFDLAVRLLSATGHALQTASTETFVFLTDMNVLFEQYAATVIETAFYQSVRQQDTIGYLLKTTKGRIAQKPDFWWSDQSNRTWIGDSKYKHLARGQTAALAFTIAEDENIPPAGRVLSPDDVRQLTVYAELYCRRLDAVAGVPHLVLLYPFVGSSKPTISGTKTWNDSPLYLVPLPMKQDQYTVAVEFIRKLSVDPSKYLNAP